jgi:hypothetical protein
VLAVLLDALAVLAIVGLAVRFSLEPRRVPALEPDPVKVSSVCTPRRETGTA